jgi:hypothetical protein
MINFVKRNRPVNKPPGAVGHVYMPAIVVRPQSTAAAAPVDVEAWAAGAASTSAHAASETTANTTRLIMIPGSFMMGSTVPMDPLSAKPGPWSLGNSLVRLPARALPPYGIICPLRFGALAIPAKGRDSKSDSNADAQAPNPAYRHCRPSRGRRLPAGSCPELTRKRSCDRRLHVELSSSRAHYNAICPETVRSAKSLFGVRLRVRCVRRGQGDACTGPGLQADTHPRPQPSFPLGPPDDDWAPGVPSKQGLLPLFSPSYATDQKLNHLTSLPG